jgi:type II secretory pathway predicted ATPase ExeA
MGKTTLVGKLVAGAPASYDILLLREQVGSVAALLQIIAAELTETTELPSAQGDLVTLIRNVLGDKRSQGQRVILVVDDAEKMYPATMEGLIRVLTKALGEGPEMLQMVLLGTKEMEKNMVATIVDYFEDETNCQLSLEPLSIKETADYLRLSLQQAASGEGGVTTAILPYQTIRAIQSQSRGYIGEINRLADKALRAAIRAGAAEISPNFL